MDYLRKKETVLCWWRTEFLYVLLDPYLIVSSGEQVHVSLNSSVYLNLIQCTGLRIRVLP